MRYITLFAFATLLAMPMQAQVIFESGFEDWTGNTPDDWFGVRTNIAASGVSQVDADVNGGTFAVRLTKEGTGHQRFSTQSVTVSDGQGYSVNFWVRGQGQIRLGLYDGRSIGSGYAPYTQYVNVTGNTWTEVTLEVTAAMDATNAEFILSVQSTVAPEHLVVDDVTISEVTITPPPTVTIQEIQETQAPDGSSPLVGQTVVTSGVVTAITTTPSNGYFIQNGPGPWSGIFVFNAPNTLAIGDAVTLTGTVAEFNGQTQLSAISDQEVTSSSNPMPLTEISTLAATTETYESVLGTVSNAVCTEVPGGANFGKWRANDGSGPVYVGKQIYTTTPDPLLGQIFDVTGIVLYSFGEFNLVPRDAGDVSLVTSIDELASTSITMYPNPASEILTLELDQVSGRTEYVISDLNGRIVANGVLNSDRTMIAVGTLANGSYVVTLRNNGSVRNLRMAVQH
jgi:hypothetical protein